jgi:hypothetical protein
MNIDDADLCVYPKSISEKKKANTELPPGTPPQKKSWKKIPQGLFYDASWLGGILPIDGKIK